MFSNNKPSITSYRVRFDIPDELRLLSSDYLRDSAPHTYFKIRARQIVHRITTGFFCHSYRYQTIIHKTYVKPRHVYTCSAVTNIVRSFQICRQIHANHRHGPDRSSGQPSPAAQMRPLRKDVQIQEFPRPAPANAQRREAVQMLVLWQGLQLGGKFQKARDGSSRRVRLQVPLCMR